MDLPRASVQKLPAGLAGVMNPDDGRDSAYYSGTDASSKHTSTASSMVPNNLNPPSTASTTTTGSDKTPSPIGTNVIPQSLISPSGSNMSVASMVSPTTPVGAARFDRPATLDSSSGTFGHPAAEFDSLSRRESVDGRMNSTMSELRLNSPYASHNHSTTSIQGTLAQQRHPRGGVDSHSMHRVSNGYQPAHDRTPDAQNAKTRTAPAITGPAQSTIARAAEPTKGQAWAFPEEEIQRVPSTAVPSLIDSRRSSVAESFASSQFTAESRLPPGQRRLDEGLAPPEYKQRLSAGSGEFPAVHHHSLQNKTLSDLQAEENGSPQGSQPYSRTPELRVSHKLAERKRRTEMKELFDQLRDLMPQERGSKASKWEILTKAITEHQRAQDQIKYLHGWSQNAQREMDILRSELQSLRVENAQLRDGLQNGHPASHPSSHPASHSSTHSLPPQAASDPYAGYSRGVPQPPRAELPPLRALSTSAQPGPESMTGVQYEQPRTSGM